VTKLLIVDDSALMRRLLTDIFEAAGDFEVAVARNGVEALGMLVSFAPDVITLDVHMPQMDGLACLDKIMVLRPCPVVMVSSLTAEGAEETLDALALGAVDFVPKPKGALSLEIDRIAEELVDKVRAASKARIPRSARLRERVRAASAHALVQPRRSRASPLGSHLVLPRNIEGTGLVLVGCSTGGPPALDALLGELPADFPWPILVAQHMPASFTGPLARRLDRLCALSVQEVEITKQLLPGHAYIGRGDADVILSRPQPVLAPQRRTHGRECDACGCARKAHWRVDDRNGHGRSGGNGQVEAAGRPDLGRGREHRRDLGHAGRAGAARRSLVRQSPA
jgi:two-component system chemotaxis response regulator CheB